MIESIPAKALVVLSTVSLWSGSMYATDLRCDRAPGSSCAIHASDYLQGETESARDDAIAGRTDSGSGSDTREHSVALVELVEPTAVNC